MAASRAEAARAAVQVAVYSQLILDVVSQFEELLLPLCLALQVAGQEPLGSPAAPGLPHALSLGPAAREHRDHLGQLPPPDISLHTQLQPF